MDDLDKLIKNLKNLTSEAKVGVFDEKNAQKLSFAEFGTRTASPRPVLTATFEQATPAINRAIDNKLKAVLDGKAITGDKILGDVGEDLVELVVDQIEGGFGKQLKESTKRGRRSRANQDTRPLLDRSSIEGGETALVDAIEVRVGKAED